MPRYRSIPGTIRHACVRVGGKEVYVPAFPGKQTKPQPVRAKMHEGLHRKDLKRGVWIYNVQSLRVGKVSKRPNAWVVFVRIFGERRHGGIIPWSLRNVRLQFGQ